MTIKVKKQGKSCKMIIEGDLTIYQANDVYEKFRKQFAVCEEIEIDLQFVSELDTAGVQILLSVKRQALEAGKQITMSMHSEPVIEVFELLNIAHEFGDPIVLSNRATS